MKIIELTAGSTREYLDRGLRRKESIGLKVALNGSESIEDVRAQAHAVIDDALEARRLAWEGKHK